MFPPNPNYQIITLFNPEDVKRIKFLLEATWQGNDRPILNYIYLDEKTGQAVAADGFRLHMCKIPEALHELTGKLIRPDGAVKRGRVIFEVQEQVLEGIDKFEYPDFMSVVKGAESHPVLYKFAFTASLVQRTMSAFKNLKINLALFKFAGPDQPFEIKAVDDQEFRAILMPAYGDEKAPEINALYEELKKTKAKLDAMERKDPKQWLAQLAKAGLVDQEGFETLSADFTAWENRLIVLENKANDLAAAQKVTGEK